MIGRKKQIVQFPDGKFALRIKNFWFGEWRYVDFRHIQHTWTKSIMFRYYDDCTRETIEEVERFAGNFKVKVVKEL